MHKCKLHIQVLCPTVSKDTLLDQALGIGLNWHQCRSTGQARFHYFYDACTLQGPGEFNKKCCNRDTKEQKCYICDYMLRIELWQNGKLDKSDSIDVIVF